MRTKIFKNKNFLNCVNYSYMYLEFLGAFCKLECWCYEAGRNPIHDSVTDVISFLAELYEARNSYCSLNSYHFVITSVHKKVDRHLIWHTRW